MVNSRYRLYSVSLLTGDTSYVGVFPRSMQAADLAVKLDR